jgi:hypothetical protein
MAPHLVDRLDVIEICTRMAWHVDQRDRDDLREVFTDEVELDCTSLNGGEPVTYPLLRTGSSWRISGIVVTATGADGNQHVMTLAAQPGQVQS